MGDVLAVDGVATSELEADSSLDCVCMLFGLELFLCLGASTCAAAATPFETSLLLGNFHSESTADLLLLLTTTIGGGEAKECLLVPLSGCSVCATSRCEALAIVLVLSLGLFALLLIASTCEGSDLNGRTCSTCSTCSTDWVLAGLAVAPGSSTAPPS